MNEFTARDAWLQPPEPSRAEILAEQLDAIVLKRLPDALSAARSLYGDDSFMIAAWVRFVWATPFDAFDLAVADAALERMRPAFSGPECDAWDDCITNGDVRTVLGAFTARSSYREAFREPPDANTQLEACAA